MNNELLRALEVMDPGTGDARKEIAMDPSFLWAVMVDNKAHRDRLVQPRIQIIAGSKGAGKSGFFLDLQRDPPPVLKRIDKDAVGLCFAFVSATTTDKCLGGSFANIAAHVRDHSESQQAPLSVAEAYSRIPATSLYNVWMNLFAYEALRATRAAVDKYMSPEQARVSRRILSRHEVTYNIRQAGDPLPVAFWRGCRRAARHVGEWLSHSTLEITYPPVVKPGTPQANIRMHPRVVGNTEHVFRDINTVMKDMRRYLLIVVDQMDEILGQGFEKDKLFLTRVLLENAVHWNYDNTFLKLLMRADYALRARAHDTQKAIRTYHVLSWSEEQFLQVVLKRLLFSPDMRRMLGFRKKVKALGTMSLSDLRYWFDLFFGSNRSWTIPAVNLPEGDAGAGQELTAREYLLRYFQGGNGCIVPRYLVLFLAECIEKEKQRLKTAIEERQKVTAEHPVFHHSTMRRTVEKYIPSVVSAQLLTEHDSIADKVGVLSELCGSRFTLKQFNDLATRSMTAEEAQSILEGLFYSGFIGGDNQLTETCRAFYFPLHFHYALAQPAVVAPQGETNAGNK